MFYVLNKSHLLKFVKTLTFDKKTYHVLGLMSGTSLDGLDMAFCEFSIENNKWSYILKASDTTDYPIELQEKLKKATTFSALELSYLDVQLGAWMGKEVKDFISKHNVQIDFISSHGHTIFHQPEKGLTLQIGNLNQLFKANNVPVVGDFRSMDVALGGQGAPLVPVGDRHLFREFDFCINLGGISNISFEDPYSNGRVAFDICPVNIVLNYLAGLKNKKYDEGGLLASMGKVNQSMLAQLNDLKFYHKNGPKSLGIEWVNDHIFPIIDNSNDPIEDKLATFCLHIAFQIKNTIQSSCRKNPSQKVLLTGGGAFNTFLVSTISDELTGITECVTPDHDTIAFKEAIIFGFLGVLKWRNEINVLASVTGAKRDSSSGIIVKSTH